MRRVDFNIRGLFRSVFENVYIRITNLKKGCAMLLAFFTCDERILYVYHHRRKFGSNAKLLQGGRQIV